ncbi:MAG: type III pantothenate kinase [Glaciecola sp.]|jgi:type III pantothenate kinase
MLLAIDAGNTQMKMAVFKNDKIQDSTFLPYDDNAFEDKLKQWLSKDIIKVGIVSVKENSFHETIKGYTKLVVSRIDLTYNFPFQIKYTTPETLGLDRIVACIGAYSLNNYEGNLMVIDAGTAITYDIVNKQQQYLGGAISPGVQMRSKALNHFTANLPLVEQSKRTHDLIGNNTINSIKSGIVNGTRFEIKGCIDEIKTSHPGVKVFLTGGDAFFFEDALKSSIFAEPNLVLIGINELMKTNA